MRYYILNKKTGVDSVPFKNRSEVRKHFETLENKDDYQFEKRFEIEVEGEWRVDWENWGYEAIKIFDNENSLRGN